MALSYLILLATLQFFHTLFLSQNNEKTTIQLKAYFGGFVKVALNTQIFSQYSGDQTLQGYHFDFLDHSIVTLSSSFRKSYEDGLKINRYLISSVLNYFNVFHLLNRKTACPERKSWHV